MSAGFHAFNVAAADVARPTADGKASWSAYPQGGRASFELPFSRLDFVRTAGRFQLQDSPSTRMASERHITLVSPPFWYAVHGPSLALPSLAGFLEQEGFLARVVDLNIGLLFFAH